MLFLIILLYALCALTFTLAKATLAYALPLFYVGTRMLFAGCLLLSLARIRANKISIKKSDWHLFLQVMLFNIYAAYLLDLWSLQYLTSIESAFVFNTSPFIAALLSYFWFGETMTSKKWLGLGIGSFALVPLLFTRGAQEAVLFQGDKVLPLIALLCSVAASAYGWIIVRELVKNRHYSFITVNGIGMLGGGLAALITSYGIETWTPSPVASWPHFLLLTLAIIIVANIAFSNLYGYLLQHYTATFLSFAGFLCPLIASFLGWFFLEEPLSWKFFYSCIAVGIGLSIFYQEELRQGYVE